LRPAIYSLASSDTSVDAASNFILFSKANNELSNMAR
jgi:hypothetical protein